MDLCRSATAGAADGLLACAALSAGGGALNLDRGAVDGSRVIGHGRHECVEDGLPAPAVAPAVEAIVDRRVGAIDRRTILPAAAAAQDMNNPAKDPPIIVPACAGVDLGKQWLNRRPGFIAKPVFVRHARSVHPANLDGLNRKTGAIPRADWVLSLV
jgi:hypothetical protein